jgi:drug/metabolite transporter (DMT)-like permease
MLSAKLTNYLHLHFIVFIWGFTAVLGALITIDAIPLVWFRMSIASIVVLAFILIRKKRLQINKKMLAWYVFAGLLIALHWLAFFHAIKVSNVSITLAMMSTGAFFTSILEPIVYKRKVIGYEILFGLIVIIALYMIFKVEGNYLYGILYALSASFLGAVFSIINGKLVKKNEATIISFYELLAGAGFISIYLLLTNSFTAEFFVLQATDWIYIGILAVFCTAYAFIASTAVMKYISPYTVMLTINLEPVYGIFLAFLIFGEEEQMSPQFYYGALIILLTVILNGVLKNWKAKRVKAF